MEINAIEFKSECLEILDRIHHSDDVIILKDGIPVAKLVRYKAPRRGVSIIGSMTGVGETVGDLTEPFNDEWEVD